MRDTDRDPSTDKPVTTLRSLPDAGQAALEYPAGFRRRRGQNWFFLGLTYAAYYLCRYNLSPVAPELMKELDLSKSQYGLINSGRDFAYAIGQMINGLFTDRLGGKQAMTIGAVGTILLNLAFGWAAWSKIGLLLPILIFIRMADGYAQAFGAPGFIKINTAWFRRKERGAFAGIFGAMINLGAAGAPQIAKLLTTGFAVPLLFFTLAVPRLDWRYVFFIPPIVLLGITILMNLAVKNEPEAAGFQIRHDDEPEPGDARERVRLIDVFRKIASNQVVWIVAGAYFCTGFVRRAVEAWWAVYLEDVWSAGKTSVYYDLFAWGLPLTATLGSMLSGIVSDRFFAGRRAPVAAVLYLSQTILTVVALALWHGGTQASAGVAVGLVLAISMMCNSTHSILGTAAAMDLGGRKMAGCSSGIIDSFQYYGAMLSGWGVGKLFEVMAGGHAPTRAATAVATAPGPAVHASAPLSVPVWFGSMLPFGILGTVLMTYLWVRHRGTDARGT